jgi:uncharacterized protein involved in outer membrane biogenesis
MRRQPGEIRWRSRGVQTPDIAIDLVADVGNTHAKARGTLFDPVHVGKLDLELALQGKDLSDLFPIVGIPLPSTPAYQLAGHLLHHDDVWTFRQFSGRVGESDLAGEFTVDRTRAVQVVRADLVSDNLRLSDLTALIGAAKPNREADQHVKGAPILPNEPFSLEKLRAAEADVRFAGRRIVTEKLPLDHMTAHLRIERGVVTVDPLDFGVAGGNIVGTISMDANPPVMAGTANPTYPGAASGTAGA